MNSENLCQPLDREYSCVDLTDLNVLSAVLSVRRPEISQAFGRCAAHLSLHTEIVNFDSPYLSFSQSVPPH
jgi:hypothetical protein